MLRYKAVVSKEPDNTYRVDIPDFPKCIATGQTREAAMEMAQVTLARHANEVSGQGRELPRPSHEDPKKHVDENVFFITIDGPEEQSAHLNLEMPLALYSRLCKAAGETRKDVQGFALQALEHYLTDK